MQKGVNSCFPSLLINDGIPIIDVVPKYNPDFFQTKIRETRFEGTLKWREIFKQANSRT